MRVLILGRFCVSTTTTKFFKCMQTARPIYSENASCMMFMYKKGLKASFPDERCQQTTKGGHVTNIVTVMSSSVRPQGGSVT